MRHTPLTHRLFGFLALLCMAAPALAHVGTGPHVHGSGFVVGFTHPWLGMDHLLAMVAVGLLAVRANEPDGLRSLWLVPAGFVSGMAIGGIASYVTLPVPGVELAISTSVILLGCALAFLPRVRAVPAALLVGLAGFFHGHAHITEMAGAVLSYASGMILATALLHTLGVVVGVLLARANAEPVVRFSGIAMAGGFALLLLF